MQAHQAAQAIADYRGSDDGLYIQCVTPTCYAAFGDGEADANRSEYIKRSAAVYGWTRVGAAWLCPQCSRRGHARL